ncbi:hypothetical protein SD81_003705 [Tolypothrix campylonemoides VB511288]|nr:hypothetical protein SD81_003705 [Tolypothrix campylonemoides VB511288]
MEAGGEEEGGKEGWRDGRGIFPHSLTPSLPHSLTPSLPHSLTPSLPHSFTPPSLPHSLTPPLILSIANFAQMFFEFAA